jgi:predicted DNA-binding transcriptional regulator YafY
MGNLEQLLITAIETGEVINIKYHGGSQPGSIRQISPISVNGDDVRARCLATNRVKVFKISKMEIEQSLSALPILMLLVKI